METDHSVQIHSSFSGVIGIAQHDITPPPGIYARNWGASNYDTAQGIHQPLMITCISFRQEQGEQPLLLIGADLGWWKNMDDEWLLRSKLLSTFNLHPSQLMFCLSHTHAGPGICSDDADKPGGDLIKAYLEFILSRSILAITEALASATNAVLTWQYGSCDLATNRDLPEPDKNRFVVGFNPCEKADDTLLVGRITDRDEHIIATIVNYACHPTTLAWENRLISPDYIGSMRELVQRETKAPCLFLQGASGELAPAEQYSGNVKLTETYGRRLGYAVLATLEAMLQPGRQLAFSNVVESGAPLALWIQSPFEPDATLSGQQHNVQLPLKQLPSISEIELQWAAATDRVMKERLLRQRGVRNAVGDGNTAVIGLWIWRIGTSFLVGHPNEAYSKYQLELRSHLAPFSVAVINVANGHIGYLPPAGLYDHNIYSVWQTPFAAGALELLTQETKRHAQEMINP